MTAAQLAKADLSPAVAALEAAYELIRAAHSDVPAATIVVKRDGRAWGHTTVAQIWAAHGTTDADHLEIMISGENLARGAVSVAATLLHEAAHAANLGHGILDTDVNGRHNRKFADRAELHGLTVTQDRWHGWTLTTLEDDAQTEWAAMIDVIDAGIARAAAAANPRMMIDPAALEGGEPATITVTPGGGITGPRRRTGNRNLAKYVCGCGHSLRMASGAWEAAQPRCTVCGEVFAAA